MPEESGTELRQFKCLTCPGKYSWHLYHLWHERVSIDNPVSKCHECGKYKKAVPMNEVEGVKICKFDCSCGNVFKVRCEMQDTAPCYNYECKESRVAPCSFECLRRIKKCTDKKHNCSKCKGGPDCPNMKPQPGEFAASQVVGDDCT